MKRFFLAYLVFISFLSCNHKTELFFNEDTQNYYKTEFVINDTMTGIYGEKMFIVFASDTNWVDMAQYGDDLLCINENNFFYSRIDFYTDSTSSPKYDRESYQLSISSFDASYLRKTFGSEIVKSLQKGVLLEQLFPFDYHLVYSKHDHYLDPPKRKCEIDRQSILEFFFYHENYKGIFKIMDSITDQVMNHIESGQFQELIKYNIDENINVDTLTNIKIAIDRIVNSKGRVKIDDFYRQGRIVYTDIYFVRTYTNEDVDLWVKVQFDPTTRVDKYINISIEKQAVDMNDKDWQDFFEQD